ncbi:hypothetical protein [Nocardia shimofusensis]|uniref:hypothetical protein n=1 Tax=Nocardia shimofusensis TaxID=228596 RepID=UPI0008356819|nr:hypothetical protein [Nocardia shimofusensis]
MGGAVREVLAGTGVCLIVAAILAFVFAGAWHTTRPPQARGGTGRLMIDTGLGLTAVGLIVAVAGLVPVRSAGSPETLPAATVVPAPSAPTPRPGGATVSATVAPAPPPP